MERFIEPPKVVDVWQPGCWVLNQSAWLDISPKSYDQLSSPQLLNPDRSLFIRIVKHLNSGKVFFNEKAATLDRKLSHTKSFEEVISVVTSLIWGSYILIIDRKEDGARLFMPDPLASVRLYYKVCQSGVVKVASDVASLLDKRSIEWDTDFLARFGETQDLEKGRSPFLGIKTIPPRCALVIERSGALRIVTAWSPRANIDDDAHENCAKAILQVFSGLAEEHPTIVPSLSGGVDSSACAVFLRNAYGNGAEISAIHLFSQRSPDYNERRMAEQVARSINADLVCIDIAQHLPLTVLRTDRPPSCLNQDMLFLSIDRAIAEVAGPSTVILEGQGGDLLFNAIPDVNSVINAFRSCGPTFAMSVAEKLAKLHNESIPRIIFLAFLSSLRKFQLRAMQRFSTKQFFLSRCNIKRVAFQSSPLSMFSLSELDKMLSLMTPNTDVSRTSRVNPFLMQPIVEAAAGMTDFESFDDKTDRLQLRRIASSYKSIDVLWRKSKGSFDVGFLNGIMSNYDQVRQLIFDGVLVNSGRLERKRIERLLRDVTVGQSAAGVNTALIACVEIFCASWHHRQNQISEPCVSEGNYISK